MTLVVYYYSVTDLPWLEIEEDDCLFITTPNLTSDYEDNPSIYSYFHIYICLIYIIQTDNATFFAYCYVYRENVVTAVQL